jgi:hypothetical protein
MISPQPGRLDLDLRGHPPVEYCWLGTDHQVIEWRPRVGVTAYVYGHHGTPAGAEVHLIRCGST